MNISKRIMAFLLSVLLVGSSIGGLSEQELETEFTEDSAIVYDKTAAEEQQSEYPAYIRLLEATQTTSGKVPEGSVVLALSAHEAMCASADEAITFTYSKAVRLTVEETADVLRDITSALCYKDDPNYPLLDVTLLVEEITEEKTEESTTEPVITEEPPVEEPSFIPVLPTMAPADALATEAPTVSFLPESTPEVPQETAAMPTETPLTEAEATAPPALQEKEALPPTRVVVQNPIKTLGVGQVSEPLDIVFFSNEEQTTSEYTVKSSSTRYVTVVAAEGCYALKGMRSGTATITVTTENGKKASFKVKVVAAPKSVTISPKKAVLAVGQQAKFSYKLTSKTSASVTFASSNQDVLIVDDEGNLFAKGEGTAIVTVKTHNGKEDKAEIKVNPQPTQCSITFNKEYVGEGSSAQATMQCDSESSLRFATEWTSLTPEILSIDKSGKITALKEGIGKIRVALTDYADVYRDEEFQVVPGPERIELSGNRKSLVMMVGNSIELPVQFFRSDGRACDADIKLVSKSTKIVSVKGTTLVPMKAGKTTITVSTANCPSIDISVTVYNKPYKIVLNHTSGELNVGEEYTLEAKVYYSSKSYLKYNADDGKAIASFVSSNEDVLTVDANGCMKAVGKGTAEVIVASGSKKAVCKVKVWAEPTDLTVSPAELILGEGMTGKVTGQFLPEERSSLSYASSEEDIAVVDGNGNVQAGSAGETIITLRTANGIARDVKVTVLPGPDTLLWEKPAEAALNLAVKQSFTISCKAERNDGAPTMTQVRYTSSNTKIATVDSNGKVKGVAVGTAVIKAESANGVTALCNVTVRKAPSKVTLSATTGVLVQGQTYQLKAKIYASGTFEWTENDAHMGSWSTSNKSIVSVENGNLKAEGVGTATITFKTYNGKKATCKVTVKKGPEWVALYGGETLTMYVGDTFEDLRIIQGDGNATSVNLTSSRPDIVSVQMNKESSSKYTYSIIAHSAGTAELRVMSDNGKVTVQTVHVYAKPESIAFEKDTLLLGLNEKVELPDLTVLSSQGECDTDVEYSVTGGSVKLVNGELVANKVGESTITAKVGTSKRIENEKIVVETIQTICKVKVLPEPTVVTITPDKTSVYEGDTFEWKVQSDTTGSYEITTANMAILQMDGERCTALKCGTAVVQVTMYNGVVGTCRLTVQKKPKDLRFEVNSMKMAVGEIRTPTVLRSEMFENVEIQYSVEPDNIVDLSVDGTLTAVREGSAVLKVYAPSMPELFDELTIAVTKPDTAIHLGVGETMQLSPDAHITMGEDVVEVNEAGLLTALSTGTAAVETTDSILMFVVHEAPDSLAFTQSTITLGCGQSYDTALSYEGRIAYASQRSDIADIDAKGIITAKSIGETMVTASTYNGQQTEMSVRVVAAPERVIVSPGRFVGCIRDTVKFTVETDFEGTDVYTWTSSDETVAKVAQDGTLTFTGIGDADITVSMYNGKTATACVTCMETPDSMAFAKDAYTMLTNCAAKPTFVFDRGAACVTLTADTSDVVRVLEDGVTVLPVKAGTATLTAEALNGGLTASCTITVVDNVTLTAELTGKTVSNIESGRSTIEVEEAAALMYTTEPQNLLAEGVAYESSSTQTAEIDKNGKVKALEVGDTVLKVLLPNGQHATVDVRVLGGKRRMMLAYYWNDKTVPGYLPFTKNCAYSMAEAFGHTTVEGQKYVISGPYGDLTKASLAQKIRSTFTDADDNDISFIYIISHGVKYGPAGEYSLQMPGGEYMSAHELMAPIKDIRGRVVLMLVSCRSGGFVDACEGILNRENGRITVLTSSGWETTSSYWTAATEQGSVDFYSYSALYALGYNASAGKGGLNPSQSHGFVARVRCDEDQNGKVTVAEIQKYASNMTQYGVSLMADNKAATIAKGQTPKMNANACTDLVLFEYSY